VLGAIAAPVPHEHQTGRGQMLNKPVDVIRAIVSSAWFKPSGNLPATVTVGEIYACAWL
jgi:hypothetical protein